jgi:hypothetical protein
MDVFITIVLVTVAVVHVVFAKRVAVFYGKLNRTFPLPWDSSYVRALESGELDDGNNGRRSTLRTILYTPELSNTYVMYLRLIGILGLAICIAVLTQLFS